MTIREDSVCLDDQVHLALELSPYLTRSRGVHFVADEGRVTLHGEVNSFFQKQMATETLRKVDGVQEIDNRLQVNWPSL